MKMNFVSCVVLAALVSPAWAKKIELAQPSAEICKPLKPSPPPPEDPNAPKPVLLPRPKVPTDLPVENVDVDASGVALIDAALAGKAPRSLLPVWYAYPWRKFKTPNMWTAYIAEAIKTDGRNLLDIVPADANWHCPKYAQMNEEQRLAFWIRLISILGYAESSMNPLSITRDTGVGANIFSTGLLQLSIESAQQAKWNCSMMKTQDDLFDWRKNVACSVRIMNVLMGEDQAFSYNANAAQKRSWYGISRYWGPFRDGRIKNDERRFCIDEVVKLRRDDWAAASSQKSNPLLTYTEYRKAGELNFERLMRVNNQFPYCN